MQLKNNSIVIDKMLFTLGWILILAALVIIAFTGQAAGYEISLYAAYPVYFWVAIIGSFSCGLFILIHQAFAGKGKPSNWYLAGIILVMVTNLIVITLPIFRNYYISDRFDEVSHLGLIKDILLNGHTGASNFYPVSHALVSQIYYIAGLDPRMILKIVPSLFYLLYMAGLFLLSRQVSKNTRVSILVTGFGAPLIFTYFNYIFLPTQFCLLILPFLLFLFFKRNEDYSLYYSILFYIGLLVIPFLHPLGSIFIVAIFFLLGLSDFIHYQKIKKIDGPRAARPFSWGVVFPPALILFITFYSWYSNYDMFKYTLLEAFNDSTSPLTVIVKSTGAAGLTISDLTRLFIINYGQDLLMLILACIAAGIVIKKLFSKDNSLKTEEVFFSIIVMVFGLFYVSTIVGSFMITGRTIRILCWALVGGVLINGLVFHEVIAKLERTRQFATGAVLVIIIASSIIGLFNVYPTINIRSANFQVTQAEMKGMQWFLDSKNSDGTFYADPFISRVPDYVYGYDSAKPGSSGKFYSIPLSTEKNVYFIISAYDIEVKKQFPDVGNFKKSDLDDLISHPGVSQIYNNGDSNIMGVVMAAW